ncbi:MAG: hypothetical protein A2283_03920 [Lentisphaerae bacterium RIFOXYA12_FULL_48_11]|nr:MAG: hypothetical protein A2283_03920 [Lentisphaerae bacterium RIFOXYA12_FULL_48_11]
MKKRAEIIKLLRMHKAALQSKYKVGSLALFGSYARGDQKPGSDVDLLVEVDPSIGLKFVSLAEEIENLIGIHVDLVSTRAVKPAKMKFIKPELIHV